MGAEARCRATFGDTTAEGKALLETDELIFRGEGLRLAIPYKTITRVDTREGALRVMWTDGTAVFELGSMAVKWADKIRNPPSRIDKLNIRAGQRVLFVGVRDETLREEIQTCGATVLARGTGAVDVIFVAANEQSDLERLVTVQKFLKRDGAIWVIRPKGSLLISEGEVRKAGKAAGLVDIKVARFSETHTAEKFVIPVSRR
jgi:hypothetical protein